MRVSDITEAMVRREFEPTILGRGEAYLKQGAVRNPKARENGAVLTAEVQGSDIDPYEARVVLGKTHIDSAECSCPYAEEWGGWCKHIAAVLLTAARHPDRFGDVPALAELLNGLDRDALQAILTDLADSDDRLADRIADRARFHKGRETVRAADPNRAVIPAFPTVDADSIRKQIRYALRGSSRRSSYYERDDSGLSEIEAGPVEDARKRLERGDTFGALAILEAVTDSVCSQYEDVDDYEGDGYGLFESLDSLWTEALLSLENVPPAQERHWTKLLKSSQQSLEDYGYEVFDAPLAALREGWNEPDLERVLSGASDRLPLSASPKSLITARIAILKRRGRTEEALRLAVASDTFTEAVTLMLELGRKPEILPFAKARLDDIRDALSVARTLEGADALDAAMDVAEAGLDLTTNWPSYRSGLAAWLRDAAEGTGDRERAARAATIALKNLPSFGNYERARALLPADRWPALRDETVNRLRQTIDDSIDMGLEDRVRVFLAEGLHGDALNAVRKTSDAAILERVAQAASETHPEAIVMMSQRVADGIINSGNAGAYDVAQHWLRRMKTIQTGRGQTEQWDAYLQTVLETHRRKYKLMALLKPLL